MSIVARIGSRFLLLGLLIGTVAMVVYMPSGEQIGLAVDQVTGWVWPGGPKPVERRGLGPAKQRWFSHLKEYRSARRSPDLQSSSVDRKSPREPVVGFGPTG